MVCSRQTVMLGFEIVTIGHPYTGVQRLVVPYGGCVRYSYCIG